LKAPGGAEKSGKPNWNNNRSIQVLYWVSLGGNGASRIDQKHLQKEDADKEP
jgi:hypothetical protein